MTGSSELIGVKEPSYTHTRTHTQTRAGEAIQRRGCGYNASSLLFLQLSSVYATAAAPTPAASPMASVLSPSVSQEAA